MSAPSDEHKTQKYTCTTGDFNHRGARKRNRHRGRRKKKPPQTTLTSSHAQYDSAAAMLRFKEKERIPIGYYLGIPIARLDSYLDQMPNITNKCLLYASGFCPFGAQCPNLQVSQSAHNAKLMLKKEQDWLNYSGHPCHYPVIHSSKSRFKAQLYNYLAVLDLEGLPEIVQFPVILINLNTLSEAGRFHKYVIPEQFIKDNVFEETKDYTNDDRANLDQYNPHANGIGFAEVMRQFDEWLRLTHHVFDDYKNGKKNIMFAICGNWDISKQIPLQCYRSRCPFPQYMHEWMNIKDFGLNLYRNAQPKDMLGMASALKFLKMDLYGTHHNGMDDTSNIAKIIVRYIRDGAVLCDTARRNPQNINEIQYRYQSSNRIGWGGRGKKENTVNENIKNAL